MDYKSSKYEHKRRCMNSQHLTKNPLSCLAIVLFIYSVYDYYDHISRTGSNFEQHPWYWLWFSFAAFSTFILITFPVKTFLEKSLKRKHLLIEIIAIGIWISLYLKLLGPILAKLIWPFGALQFGFSFSFFFIILIFYFIIRISVNAIRKKPIMFSN